ncbi:hypothetical protein AMTR_s00144p00076400 [Amborella trichopoda]|uniref:Uncharacterized protein n=1 Tax=Amborella trichopoda TaxID=13333 RepID=W1P9N2_AMBTC|nr:hypothetical protein AMTR_s00144p00076400 [Amborella trichopoda]
MEERRVAVAVEKKWEKSKGLKGKETESKKEFWRAFGDDESDLQPRIGEMISSKFDTSGCSTTKERPSGDSMERSTKWELAVMEGKGMGAEKSLAQTGEGLSEEAGGWEHKEGERKGFRRGGWGRRK